MKKIVLLFIVLFSFSFTSHATKYIIYRCGAQPEGRCGSLQPGDCSNFTPSAIVVDCIDIPSTPIYGGGVKIHETLAFSIVLYGNGDVYYQRNEPEDEYLIFNAYNYFEESEDYGIQVEVTDFTPNEELEIKVSKLQYKHDLDEMELLDVATDEIDLTNTNYEFSVSPNPASGIVTLSNKGFELTTEAIEVVLYDQYLVSTNFPDIKDDSYTFDVGSLNSGYYIYIVLVDSEPKFSGIIQINNE